MASKTRKSVNGRGGQAPRRNGRGRSAARQPAIREVPAHASSLVGRTTEISHLLAMLESQRLITLTGPPGIGKTRLALEIGRELRDRSQAEVHVVELADISRSTHVARAVASVVSAREDAGRNLTEGIVRRLCRGPAVLVLDNCEHLRDACAKLVAAVVSGCPELRVLTTSRQALGLEGERVWEVGPLSVPPVDERPRPETACRYAAVRLFAERAQAARPSFVLTSYVAAAVVEICRSLDGIPLAIELAAARVQSLTPSEILTHLDDRFELLAGMPKGLSAHRSLEGAIASSYDLLSEREQVLLRRLSVFVGSFDLEAAEAVCTATDMEAGHVADLMAMLVSKSLVSFEPRTSPTRYRLLETIRAYAGERLQAAEETAMFRDAHARWSVALAEQAEPELTRAGQHHWLARLAGDYENLRAALEWSLSQGEAAYGLRLASALVLFWRVRCHFSEGRELLDAAIAASDDDELGQLRAKALWGSGLLALMAGDVADGISRSEEALGLFREVDDQQGCARALLVLGNCMQYRDDPKRTLSVLNASATIAREVGDSWCLAHALAISGFERSVWGEFDAARTLFEECLDLARDTQDKQSLLMGLIGLGLICVNQGDYASAETLLLDGKAVASDLGEDYSKGMALQYLSLLAMRRGDYQAARSLLDDALSTMPEAAPPEGRSVQLVMLAAVARREGDEARARLLLEQALAGRDATPIDALLALGELAAATGDLPWARDLFEQAVAAARASGAKQRAGRGLFALGELARGVGDLTRSTVLHEEALQLRHEVGGLAPVVESLEAVAGLKATEGQYERSARLLGAVDALRRRNGCSPTPWRSQYPADVVVVRGALDCEGFEAAFRDGAGLSIEEAVAEALERPRSGAQDSRRWAALSQRELEIVALVAHGLSNPQIAERLFISLSTVKAALSQIFAKLGVTRRTQLAREYSRQGTQPQTNAETPGPADPHGGIPAAAPFSKPPSE